MSVVNQELIYQTLLKQNEQLGRIEANVSTIAKRLDEHVEDDKKLEVRLSKIEAYQNRSKGASKAFTITVSAVITLISWFVGSRH